MKRFDPKCSERIWTYADYCSWPDNGRWELIDGVAHNVPPSPSRKHQQVLGGLVVQFTNYFHLTGRKQEVYMTPFDVRLPSSAGINDDDITTVVQPDIFVVCNLEKLDDRGCFGAPDLIVEITSPSTAFYDQKVKLELYERTGVKEFWIIQPVDKTVMVFRLTDTGAYGCPEMYGRCDLVPVSLLGDLRVTLEDVFSE